MIRRPPSSTLFPYTDALPIWFFAPASSVCVTIHCGFIQWVNPCAPPLQGHRPALPPLQVVRGQPEGQHLRSEEHTSELQSLAYLVCRLLLEKKKNITRSYKNK